MGLEALREGYHKLLGQIYAPQFYYERVLTFLREYNPPTVRFHYWRFFFWTIFRRPRLFPLAITLAIMGYHFRQVTELHVG